MKLELTSFPFQKHRQFSQKSLESSIDKILMASRNGNRAFENAALQMQFEDTGIKTERKAEKDLGGVTDVSANPNDRFQKKETNTASPDSEAVYESLTKIQQGKLLFRCVVYLMSFLLVFIFLTTAVNLVLNWSHLNSPSGMLPLV